MTIRFIGRALGAVIAVAGLAGTAQATSIDATWTNTYNVVQTLNYGSKLNYTHDLTKNGFSPGDDWIDSILLTIDLRDDSYDPSNQQKEWAKVDVDLLFLDAVTGPGSQDYTFEYGNGLLHFFGLLGLNSSGLLDVSISSVEKCEGSLWNRTCTSGDFVFGGSTLVAKGKTSTPPTPVPEPTVLGLFGLGLLGIAANARRRKAKGT